MRSRRESPCLTAETFLTALRAADCFRCQPWTPWLRKPLPPIRAWASELVERGLLTGYQAEQIFAGNAHFLLLGQYRILDALGAGGMGRVFKAEHVLMRRVVALKVVGAAHDTADHAARHAAFLREIEAAARLSHPNIVAAYDAGEANGLRFLVMEYVDGIDLERLVRTVGPLTPRCAGDYARQTALALEYAFERGVLHRDVKPANLLLESGGDPRSPGRIKVLDLGLARTTRGGDSEADEASRLSGTPDYIAPEVAHNADSRDVRSDLYSLGCTLYYLLTGSVPFPGGTWTEKLLRHQYETPLPLCERAPAVPARLAAIIATLMAKAPAERHETPAAVAHALDDWLALGEDPPAAVVPREPGEPSPPSPSVPPTRVHFAVSNPGPPSVWDVPVPSPEPPRSRSRRWSWALVIVAAFLAGLAGAWLLRNRPMTEEGGTTAPSPAGPPFILARSGAGFDTFAAVIEAAKDGDTITIHGNGPFAIRPVVLRGKSLAVRAAAGSSPILEWDGPPVAWQALLTTDRTLDLEGIELRRTSGSEPAQLLCATGAAVRMTNCRVTAPHQSAPIVARGVGRLELHDCHITAGGLRCVSRFVPVRRVRSSCAATPSR